jgi:mannose-6-phosphate isomerase-like protein (cupin superfamily)
MSEVATRPGKTAAKPQPIKYSMRGTQMLSSGMTTITLAAADNMWLASKVYSRGGENALHAHVYEDHSFFVLQGAAIFEYGDGSTQRVERYEGVMLPKGVVYRFQAQGSENLVMLRMGACQLGDDWSGEVKDGSPLEIRTALDEHGKPILNNKSLAKGKTPAEPVVPLAGKTFPQD